MNRSALWSTVLPFVGYVLLVSSAVLSSFGIVANALLLVGFSLLFLTRSRLKTEKGDAEHRSTSVAAGDRTLVLCATLLFAAIVVDSMSLDLDFVEHEGRALVSLLVLSLVDVRVLMRVKAIERFLVALSMVAALALGLFLLGGEFRALVQQQGPNGVFQGFGSSHHVTGLVYGSIGVSMLYFVGGGPMRRIGLALPAFGVALLTSSRTTLLVFVAASLIWGIRKLTSEGWKASPAMVALGAVVALVISANTLLLVLEDDFALSPSDAASELDLPSMESFSRLSNLGPADDRRLGVGVQARSGREANVLIRFQAWRYALEDGLSSPLVGIGPFRFNDLGRLYATPVPGVRLATGAGQPNTTDFGAHNLYLQIFAELGVMGLALLLWLQIGLSNRVRQRIEQPFLVSFVLAVIWASGLVSNSLLSPGLVIALLIPLIPRLDHAEQPPQQGIEEDQSFPPVDGQASDPFAGDTIDPGSALIDLREPEADVPPKEPVTATATAPGLFETARVFAVDRGRRF